MPKIFTIEDIKRATATMNIVDLMEAGFVQYSKGNAVVPPVAELTFNNPPGDVHIKYGYIEQDSHYVIKIASSFYENPRLGLSSSNGLMLVFNQHTGELESILLDEGYLTDLRTAAAGALAARYLAPEKVTKIGIVGSGIQARMQLEHLKDIVNCNKAMAWGRNRENLQAYQKDMERKGFDVEITDDLDLLAAQCNLIVTATAATAPLLHVDQIQPGTHITAVGSDTAAKQELDAAILKRADILVADSISQCVMRGEISKALAANQICEDQIIELGKIPQRQIKRTSQDQISVADLTGVAVQDIQIAKAVCQKLTAASPA